MESTQRKTKNIVEKGEKQLAIGEGPQYTQARGEKMQKDSKLDKMREMSFVRTNISYYGKSKLNAIVVYTDNKDEYNVYLVCSILGEKIQLDTYRISKGAVVGF